MVGRVHETRIDVTKFLERKQVGRVLGVFEDKGGRSVEGNSSGSPMAEPVGSGVVGSVSSVPATAVRS